MAILLKEFPVSNNVYKYIYIMPNAKLYSKLWYAITWERKSKEKTKEKVSTHAKLYPEMSAIRDNLRT